MIRRIDSVKKGISENSVIFQLRQRTVPGIGQVQLIRIEGIVR